MNQPPPATLSTDRRTLLNLNEAGAGQAIHPLGPLVRRHTAARPLRSRMIAAAVLMGCVALLSTAATLSPDTTGMGTHRQLGYPSCLWPMATGYPCPTCGMTTAFAHAVRGQLWSAFLAQPAGLTLAIGTLIAALVSAWSLLTGWVWSVNWYRLRPDRVAMILVAMIVAGWVFKLAMVWLARQQAIGS